MRPTFYLSSRVARSEAASAVLSLILAGSLAVVGSCAPNLKNQKMLSALGGRALDACKADHNTCAKLQPCMAEISSAMRAVVLAQSLSVAKTPSEDADQAAKDLIKAAEDACRDAVKPAPVPK